MPARKLEKIFNPKGIAVVGATNKKGHVGYSLMKNLVGSGYEGIVYPVNITRESVYGVKAYKSLSEVPGEVDLAVVATPAATVPGIVDECGKKGVKGVVIISSGFKEAGKEGGEMCAKILETAKLYGMRIIGPNCLGFIKPSISLNASFANKMALPGRIAFISQSGALGTAILDWSVSQNVGFSHFISIGSMIDVGFHDLIDYFGQDPGTTSILLYMESLTDARQFMSATRAFARAKPIIILKAGKSSEGAQAAKSHTGSITGDDAVFDAAFKRAGAIRVNTIGELFACAQTLTAQKKVQGRRLAIVTNAGGAGVVATDSLIELGGTLAKLSDGTMASLDAVMPANWSRGNPVDVLGDADPERYRKAMEACIADEGVDGILTILTPQAMTDAAGVAKEITALQGRDKKPILTSWMGEEDVNKGKEILEKGNIPVYKIPETAARSFMDIYRYSRNLELLYETPATIPHAFRPEIEKNRELISGIMKEGRFALTESEAKQVFENYGIPTVKSGIAATAAQAGQKAAEIGFPVVMKILSPDVLHKTDAGGVKLDIKTKEEAEKAFDEINASVKKYLPAAKIVGVIIEEMVSKRYELLIGCKKDPIFGPVIVFGMGGIAVEVFKDVDTGLPPLNMALAMRMIEETKIYTLLKGYRGMKGVDIPAIQFLLYKFAYLVIDFPQIKEVDINPFAVDENGGVVLDAKILLDEKTAGKDIKPYSHLVILPYPKEYVRQSKMRNGREFTLRPIRPEDEPMEAEMFKNFSEETLRFRFFQLIKNITHEFLIRFTQIDYDREIAIIAEVEEDGGKKMAGVVRLVADPDIETAEFAIVVADPWQRQGIGSIFTDYILEIAKEKGLKAIYASVMKSNYIMIHMFRKRGFRMEEKDDMYHAELILQ
ncbi:acetyl CoA synthetase subunit alpha [Candidatus Desantisbacteria bacterium CG1_02_49_89]|nr:MAG: acetyl CoA synthetase subunit alpha [Candidatus Desantisbacteria bacterium CG1_02_49_89]